MITTKNKRKDRLFGLITGLFLLGFSMYSYFQLNITTPWLIGIGCIITLAALFIPNIIYPFRTGMEIIGHWMGIVNTYVLLTLIYILLFLPLNLVFKISGKDTLKLNWDKRKSSYWNENTQQDDSSMKNQY